MYVVNGVQLFILNTAENTMKLNLLGFVYLSTDGLYLKIFETSKAAGDRWYCMISEVQLGFS